MDINDKIIKRAISLLQGEPLETGTICAHPSDPIAYKLIRYENNIAVLLSTTGEEKYFPASEIFDCNKCKKMALNIKFGIDPYLNIE